MLGNIVKKVFGTKNDREIKRFVPAVERINGLEPEFEKLTDPELREKTDEFRQRLGGGEALDDLLPEAFAATREASRRTIGLRHFDAQLIGGMVLHEGKIAEMKTGEGKTLVATLPFYLNALTGKGVHLITVNDYLARRDVQWMGPIYHALGLSVASIVHDVSYRFDPAYITKDYRYLNLRPISRQDAYAADITYGTNNEFGFRLPAGQHEVRAGRVCPAGSELRGGGRGGQHPHRRGAHPAHHLRAGGGVHRQVLHAQPHHPQAPARRGDPGRSVPGRPGGRHGPGGLHHRRKSQDRVPHRKRRGQGGAVAGGAQPLRPAAHRHAASRQPGPQGPQYLQARRGLRHQGRRGHHRRRVHRPAHAGAALVRRAAPGGGGQGRGAYPRGEPDPRHHHDPELLPHVRQARGHDRHRRHRGPRVQEDLQPRRGGGADPSAHGPAGPCRRGVPHRAGKVRGGGGGDRRVPCQGTAGAGGDGVGAEVGASLPDAQEEEDPPQRAQRGQP